MNDASLLSSLNLFTLVAVLVVLIASFAYFLRRRKNREATSRALGINDPPPSERR